MKLYFDRGTIVIENGFRVHSTGKSRPWAKAAVALPHYFRWDPRVLRWRSPGYRLAQFLEWLGSHEIPCEYESPRPRNFLPVPVPDSRLPVLRPYQQEALEAWTAAGRRGLIQLPTGSGKTRLAIRAMLRLRRPTLIVVPTRQLLHQWVEAIHEFYPARVGRYGDGFHDVYPITVATFESAHIHLDVLGDHFDLLVADEAHHLASERLSEIAQMSTAGWRLGLSATFPTPRTRMKGLENLLGAMCFSLPIAKLSGKYLATFEAKIIPLHLSPAEQKAYEEYRMTFLLYFKPFLKEFPDGEWKDFITAASRSPGGRKALHSFRKSKELLSLPRCKLNALDQLLDRHCREPALVFTANNRAAYKISEHFLVAAMTCDIERAEREVILARFRSGIYRALVSSKVLNEGIDVPAASVAIVVGGSSRPGEHAQRLGRILRPVAGKKSIIYELVIAGTTDWTTSERRSRIGAGNSSPSL